MIKLILHSVTLCDIYSSTLHSGGSLYFYHWSGDNFVTFRFYSGCLRKMYVHVCVFHVHLYKHCTHSIIIVLVHLYVIV